MKRITFETPHDSYLDACQEAGFAHVVARDASFTDPATGETVDVPFSMFTVNDANPQEVYGHGLVRGSFTIQNMPDLAIWAQPIMDQTGAVAMSAAIRRGVVGSAAEGARVSLSLRLPDVPGPVDGDVFEVRADVATGFDGSLSSVLIADVRYKGFFVAIPKPDGKAGGYKQEPVKHTKHSNKKVKGLAGLAAAHLNRYVDVLVNECSSLQAVSMDDASAETIILKALQVKRTEGETLPTRSQNNLDKILGYFRNGSRTALGLYLALCRYATEDISVRIPVPASIQQSGALAIEAYRDEQEATYREESNWFEGTGEKFRIRAWKAVQARAIDLRRLAS